MPPDQRTNYHCEREATGPVDRKQLIDHINKIALETPDQPESVPFVAGVVRGKKVITIALSSKIVFFLKGVGGVFLGLFFEKSACCLIPTSSQAFELHNRRQVGSTSEDSMDVASGECVLGGWCPPVALVCESHRSGDL